MTFGTVPSQQIFLSWLKILNPQVRSLMWQYFHLDSSSTELFWPWNINCILTFRQKPYDYTMLKELNILAQPKMFLQRAVGSSKSVTNETLFINICFLQNCVDQPIHISLRLSCHKPRLPEYLWSTRMNTNASEKGKHWERKKQSKTLSFPKGSLSLHLFSHNLGEENAGTP